MLMISPSNSSPVWRPECNGETGNKVQGQESTIHGLLVPETIGPGPLAPQKSDHWYPLTQTIGTIRPLAPFLLKWILIRFVTV